MYDDIGQLVLEDNSLLNRTFVYTYDDAGNILLKKTYALTAAGATPTTLYSTYSYGYTDSWGDLLTSYRGVSFTYDEIGNPLTYYNGSSYTFTWENGRRLKTATVGSNTLSFTYNHDGIRTSKTVNGVVHNYTVSGSLILTEEWGTNLVVYLYDANGAPIGMRYRTNSMAEGVFYTFWFDKNLQGDVVAVYNETGTKVLSYTYDAWGNKTTTVHNNSGTNSYAQYNAITYRGYYFDSETSLYYVSNRYYDPAIGRFINADAFVATGQGMLGQNMFAYCGNNPVARVDLKGEWWNVVIGAVVGGLIGAISTAVQGGSKTEILVSAACGAVSGALAATGLGGVVGQMAVGAITSAVDSGYQNYNDYKSGDITLGEAIGGTLVDSAVGAAFGAMGAQGTTAFKESTKIANKTNKAIFTLAKKTVHPTVRKTAKEVIRQGRKYFVKEVTSSLVDNIATTVTGNFISDVSGQYIKAYN